MNVDEMRDKIAAMVGEAVTKGVCVTLRDIKEKGDAVPAAVNLGCNTALMALLPIVPFLCKRPFLNKEEAKERGHKELTKLLTHESILFATLIVARMMGESTVKGFTTKEGEEGAELSQEVNFGPHVLHLAIEDWKKVTGKDPADYIDNLLLNNVAEAERDSLAPFEEFLKGRSIAPSSKTLN